jgi:hypothetical protein
MYKLLFAAPAVLLVAGAQICAAQAATRTLPMRSCNRIQVPACDAYRCTWHSVCAYSCPDGYSCAPLYGAYGPFGGAAYWAGYTSYVWGRP